MSSRLYILSMLLLSGCAAVSMVAQKTMGPPPVPAKHTLAKVPTLIFVENYRNASAAQVDSENLARALIEEFEQHELAPLVETDRIYLLRDNDPKAFSKMKIPAIGRACGAEQIVYVDLLDLGVGMEHLSKYARGGGSARVRVVDSKTGNTIWPEDVPEGHPASYQMRLNSTTDSLDELRARVVKGTADRITRLFYKYKPDEMPE